MENFIGEIRLFGGNYAPEGWALCDGRLLAIASNQALFSLLSTTYGGDGQSTFGLPDLRGRLPLHQGTGPGLTTRTIGQSFGSETVALTVQNLPPHSHTVVAATSAADVQAVTNAVPAAVAGSMYTPYASANVVELNPAAVSNAGAGNPHANLMPAQCINFIIALTGIYPTHN